MTIEDLGSKNGTFVNGVKVGATGRMPPKYDGLSNTYRRYKVDAKHIRPGAWNLIAVRAYDKAGGGGICRGEPGLFLGKKGLSLAGMWELRTRARVHTSSSLMCWAACDRLAHAARALALPDRAALWHGRAKIIREMCHKVLAKMGRADNPLLELAQRLEEIALKDDYFIARKLYPNVDFYSGIIYSALGIPRSMFTVMFAIARTAGWVSHWQEMISDPGMKIGRPRQLYTGPVKREYTPITKR